MEYDFLTEQDAPDEYISVIVPTGNMQDGMIFDSANIIKNGLPKPLMGSKRQGSA